MLTFKQLIEYMQAGRLHDDEVRDALWSGELFNDEAELVEQTERLTTLAIKVAQESKLDLGFQTEFYHDRRVDGTEFLMISLYSKDGVHEGDIMIDDPYEGVKYAVYLYGLLEPALKTDKITTVILHIGQHLGDLTKKFYAKFCYSCRKPSRDLKQTIMELKTGSVERTCPHCGYTGRHALLTFPTWDRYIAYMSTAFYEARHAVYQVGDEPMFVLLQDDKELLEFVSQHGDKIIRAYHAR